MKAPSDPANPKPIEKFLHGHPAALAFVQTPKPVPSSLARDTYFGVSAYRFISPDGKVKYGRYRIVPVAGPDYLDAAAVAAKGPNFLFEEIVQRVSTSAITFKVVVQVANDGDVTDDATVHWPKERALLELGTITLTAPVANDAAEQQRIIMDPIPRVTGIEPSDDPLLEVRAAVYLLTGRRRRAAHA
jgi:catalase